MKYVVIATGSWLAYAIPAFDTREEAVRCMSELAAQYPRYHFYVEEQP